MVNRPLNSSYRHSLFKTLAFNLFLALSLLFSSQAWSKTVTVETDRQTVEFGDIVTLKITADFQVTTGQLDLTQLKDQFEVLGTQRSNNIQMVNGNFQSSTSWIIQLLPQQQGELIIPPFVLENVKSQPYSLKVTPIQVQHKGTSLRPFFLESSIDQPKPYIQQQVIYTLRFYHQGRYVDGLIRPPKFEKMLIEELKEQSVYQKKIQGKSYTVYEWIYALYPQSSGQIKIDPPMFNGRIQYAGRLKQVKEFAKGITLAVKAEPSSFDKESSNSWLPAKSVTLTENWTQPVTDKIRIGDTLTQVVTMNVIGQKANQLPNLKLLSQLNYKVYPEKPNSAETKTASGINSVKQFKRSIIVTKAGSITLPEQVLYWWNTQTNKLEKTTLPAKTFEVEAALIEQQSLVDCTLPTHDLQATPGGLQSIQGNVSSIWQWLSALFAVLWLATLAWLIKQRQQQHKRPQTAMVNETVSISENSQAWSDLDSICELPAKALYPAIKQWLKNEYDIQHFGQLEDQPLQHLLQQLEAGLYSSAELDSQLTEQLCQQLKSLQQTGLAKQQQSDSKLKSLYAR